MKIDIPSELRPTCSCGTEMNLDRYIGRTDELLHWICSDRDCYLIDFIIKEKMKIDNEIRGSFVSKY